MDDQGSPNIWYRPKVWKKLIKGIIDPRENGIE